MIVGQQRDITTMDSKRLALKDLRIRLDALAVEQKSIPLTLENCTRKQAIQDRIAVLNEEFRAISRTINTH